MRCRQILLGLLAFTLPAPASAQPGKTTILVDLPDGAVWQDFAFLAAVPAGAQANGGAPSVLALGPTAETPTKLSQFYGGQYRPDKVFAIGPAPFSEFGGKRIQSLDGNNPTQVAVTLSQKFWKRSENVVLCSYGNYKSALIASALAARLHAPLLYFSPSHSMSSDVPVQIARLGATRLLVIGDDDHSYQVTTDRSQEIHLADAKAVLTWVRERKLSADYIAAVNPTDRTQTVIKKLSLAGPLLAAGHNGLVYPIAEEVHWKVTFPNKIDTGRVLGGLLDGLSPKTGYSVWRTADPNEWFVQFKKDNEQGPKYRTGDLVNIAGNRCTVDISEKNSPNKSPLSLTWPRAEDLADQFHADCEAAKIQPKYLCLIGFPDAIPQAVIGNGGIETELVSDLPYARERDNKFADIAVGRVVAENASEATIYASRVLTYNQLRDNRWGNQACEACWENTFQKPFENVGFKAGYLHDRTKLNGKTDFTEDSPLAHCALLSHTEHSWWREIGSTFTWNADTLMAPTVVESGGCSTTTIDQEADYHCVTARLFRNGAASFVGSARNSAAQEELQREAFWACVLDGETVGEAHLQSINIAETTILDKGEDEHGVYQYQLNVRTLMGDPAFRPHLPQRPTVKPAHTETHGNRITVVGPKEWWTTKIVPVPDWKEWNGKDLYAIRAPGIYAQSGWCAQQYNLEQPILVVEKKSAQRITNIKQIEKTENSLGWTGKWFEQKEKDGTYTYRWLVNMAAFDQIHNKLNGSVKQLDFDCEFAR